MPTVKLPHMVLRRRMWFARMIVPEGLRALLDRSVLIQTTGHRDPLSAAPVANRIVVGWRRDLAEARGQKVEMMEEHHTRYMSASQRTAHQASKGPPPVTQKEIDRWRDGLSGTMRPRQAHQYANDVALWALGTLPPGDAFKTRSRRLSAIRKFCKDTGRPAPQIGTGPTDVAPVVQAPKAQRKAKRGSFMVAEVVRLRDLAEAGGDPVLADLIWLALHTGARLEELATLRVSSVDTTRRALKVSSKTDAGDRVIPIHSALEATLKRLLASPQGPEGYLLHSTAENKLGERGMAFGKRFGRLKGAAGHDSTLVFHSIRKTVATALQDAGCPEPTAADILGHEIATMSYGVYSTGSSLETRRGWLEAALTTGEGHGQVHPKHHTVHQKHTSRDTLHGQG